VQQLLSAGLALSSIWEKARARDRQREVARDKGQWGFVLQGMRPAEAQAVERWQGAVLINQEAILLQKCLRSSSRLLCSEYKISLITKFS
jgi:hypothetical protein